jgi:hypothetical protein
LPRVNRLEQNFQKIASVSRDVVVALLPVAGPYKRLGLEPATPTTVF